MTLKNEHGKFDAYAWPGGYPIFYLTVDGGALCAACANGENGSEASEESDDPQWHIVGRDVNWEDANMQCDHCGRRIESAYGEESEDQQ